MRRYFATGCTGWLGTSIVAELLRRDDTESICLLTREDRVSTDYRIRYWQGDIIDDPLPHHDFTHVIHGANGSHFTEPLRCYFEIVEGTRRVMEWAKSQPCAILYLSSGAVSRDTAYGRGKRIAERLLPYHARIARFYTLIGPDTPTHYAVGAFISQAISDGRVVSYGGENIYRSYLHTDDAARWTLKILNSGSPATPYDVGGDAVWSVDAVAMAVATTFGVPLEVVKHSRPADSYLPDVSTTKRLSLKSSITLTQALERIRDDYRLRNPHLEETQAA